MGSVWRGLQTDVLCVPRVVLSLLPWCFLLSSEWVGCFRKKVNIRFRAAGREGGWLVWIVWRVWVVGKMRKETQTAKTSALLDLPGCLAERIHKPTQQGCNIDLKRWEREMGPVVIRWCFVSCGGEGWSAIPKGDGTVIHYTKGWWNGDPQKYTNTAYTICTYIKIQSNRGCISRSLDREEPCNCKIDMTPILFNAIRDA